MLPTLFVLLFLACYLVNCYKIIVPVVYDKGTGVIAKSDIQNIIYPETLRKVLLGNNSGQNYVHEEALVCYRTVFALHSAYSWPTFSGSLEEVIEKFKQVKVPITGNYGVFPFPVPSTFYELFSLSEITRMEFRGENPGSNDHKYSYAMTKDHPDRIKLLEQWEKRLHRDMLHQIALTLSGKKIGDFRTESFLNDLIVWNLNHLIKIRDFVTGFESHGIEFSDFIKKFEPHVLKLQVNHDSYQIILESMYSRTQLFKWPASLKFINELILFDGEHSFDVFIEREWKSIVNNKILMYHISSIGMTLESTPAKSEQIYSLDDNAAQAWIDHIKNGLRYTLMSGFYKEGQGIISSLDVISQVMGNNNVLKYVNSSGLTSYIYGLPTTIMEFDEHDFNIYFKLGNKPSHTLYMCDNHVPQLWLDNFQNPKESLNHLIKLIYPIEEPKEVIDNN
ncbi:hypothetical protein ROZALSC1DRAFT_23535 [Rozella allomycis CSF55]|uniref:Uncharacterized protein n=1 Tax=Rozella allomycis (strain CSF55) TaxID=988480 RepID=A0A4P9YG08_ROZAC|nr:hypothetical protein ROZALSC1DRAFT_23535 [Rozella allomycis CSF55]